MPVIMIEEPTHSDSDLSSIQSVYLHLKEVFKTHNCATELLPGTMPRSSLLTICSREVSYAKSAKYVNETLLAWIIQPSSCLTGAEFVFVEEMDGSNKPYIDFNTPIGPCNAFYLLSSRTLSRFCFVTHSTD